ncbi:MAG: PASTA domain-containing protein [Clostridia bacterium]|nr:PASTA domain-containing protein [Clostridia bacterium]
MSRKEKKKLRDRALLAMVLTLVLGFGTGVFGMINVGLIHGEENRRKAESEQLSDTVVAARRGTIYDSNMNILAQSTDAWKIYVNPSEVPDEAAAKKAAMNLSNILDIDYDDTLEACLNKDRRYIVLKSKVDFATKEKIEKLRKDNKGFNRFIGIEDDVTRFYPFYNFASTVIGFTGSDDKGMSGLESAYNTKLTGLSGRNITAQNAKQREIASDFSTYYAAQEGVSLQLTIDNAIQYYLDSALSSAIETQDATYGYGIVMDVKTGAILAMSSQPDYDLNDPYAVSDEKTKEGLDKITDDEERAKATTDALFAQWRNRTVTDTYEPGSVFKCVTAAAGIEEGVVTPDEMFVCGGSYKVKDITYHCSNRRGHGSEDFTTSLMNSCNPIYIQVAQRLGSEKFSQYFEAFGLGETTGVDLAAEAAPKPGVTYYTADRMGPVELASSSFGQSFQITPIQICTAINTIANDGKLVQPYIVAKEMDSEGNVVRVTKPTVRRQVVSKKTADTVTQMMVEVVRGGTAKNATVAGYKVAGKTGTSEKLTTKQEDYIGSFCGFAPADDPEISVIIIIDDPKSGSYTGGKTAAPVAAEVIGNTLRYLNIEPEYEEGENAGQDVRTPSVTGLETAAASETLSSSGFTVKVIGEGKKVKAQAPEAGKLIPRNGVVVLYTESEEPNETVEMPNLIGMSVSQARYAAKAAGLNVQIVGTASDASGASYGQSISKGTKVALGSTVTVSYMTTSTEMEIEDTGNAD